MFVHMNIGAHHAGRQGEKTACPTFTLTSTAAGALPPGSAKTGLIVDRCTGKGPEEEPAGKAGEPLLS